MGCKNTSNQTVKIGGCKLQFNQNPINKDTIWAVKTHQTKSLSTNLANPKKPKKQKKPKFSQTMRGWGGGLL